MTAYDARAAADQASAALRTLAHTTRTLDQPADTYPIVGDLLAATTYLQQVLDQLANTHLRHRDSAGTDAGDRLTGRELALYAGDELRHAARSVRQAQVALDAASIHSGRIAWHTPSPRPTPPTSVLRHLDTPRPLSADRGPDLSL
jgi:hypothetical protein